jgi:hypothetical protein
MKILSLALSLCACSLSISYAMNLKLSEHFQQMNLLVNVVVVKQKLVCR